MLAVAPEALAQLDFDLPDVHGHRYRLSTRQGIGPTVVVFFRGHWCPYCRRYLAKLQFHLPRILAAGNVDLVAISVEPCSTSAVLTRELGLTYPVLCDADGLTVDRFGVRNGFRAAASLIHPAVFIFDADLHLRFKSIDRNYKVRTSVRTILKELDAIAAAALDSH